MTRIEKLYNSSPVWLQNVICSAKGYLINRRRYGKGFYEALSEYEQNGMTHEQRLHNFLSAIKYVPYYSHYPLDKMLSNVNGRGGYVAITSYYR